MRARYFTILLAAAAAFLTEAATAQNTPCGIRVVVIDPGHGGDDPGAHYFGTDEKTLTLTVALKLGQLIEEGMPGVKVVYTRTTDKALAPTKIEDLQARADIANRAGGDLFVSIHVNAAKEASARGVETLVMGESTKEQRYNEDALYENNRDDLIDMSDERTAAIVRAYIQNLQFTYGEYSLAMARFIQSNYVKTGRRSRGVKPQLLRVLYATDMPGVLTEIGFLSNPKEAVYLKSEAGQDEIARSLFVSVKNYSDYVLETRRRGRPRNPLRSRSRHRHRRTMRRRNRRRRPERILPYRFCRARRRWLRIRRNSRTTAARCANTPPTGNSATSTASANATPRRKPSSASTKCAGHSRERSSCAARETR